MGKETGMKETVDNVLDDIAAKRAAASEKQGRRTEKQAPRRNLRRSR